MFNNSTSKKQFDKYSRKMMGICLRYTKSSGQAELMLTEGFIRILKSESDYELVKRTMIKTIIDKLTIDTDATLTDVVSPCGTTTNDLIKLLQRLPTVHQVIFNLHTVDGYSKSEGAKMLNISEHEYASKLLEAQDWIDNSLKLVVI